MRYNKDAEDYERYYNMVKIEERTQKNYYDKIRSLQDKINYLQGNLSRKNVEFDKDKVINELMKYNKKLDKYSKEIEYSKEKQHYLEQKICAHDFGIIIRSRYDEENDKVLNSGICLECGEEIVDVEGNIFKHSIVKSDDINNAMTFNEYVSRLQDYIYLYRYNESDYDYKIGEIIVSKLVDDAKKLKRSRCK